MLSIPVDERIVGIEDVYILVTLSVPDDVEKFVCMFADEVLVVSTFVGDVPASRVL